MRTWVVFLLPLISAAQPAAEPPGPPPLVRGVLLERDAHTNGEFSVRAADNQVYRYRFDGMTYVERDNQLVDVARLRPGEKVEVISDRLPGSAWRYARTIHVIQPAPPLRPPAPGMLRTYRSPLGHIVSTGSLTFSGVVLRLNGERLVLRTRAGGEHTLALRQDTRYLEDGQVVDAAALRPTMRVFVRAGKDLYDQLEAYQVVWGGILAPR